MKKYIDGKVLIDGMDVKKVSIESLRKQMGIMTQDNFLFSGTIKDNIRYGKLDATDEEFLRTFPLLWTETAAGPANMGTKEFMAIKKASKQYVA